MSLSEILWRCGGDRTIRRAYHRESFSSSLKACQQSEDPFGAGSTRECGFREGAMVSGDTCLIVKNWTFLPANHWRRCRWCRRFCPSRRTARDAERRRCNEDKARRRVSAPLGMHGSIHQRRTVVSSSGILYRCPSYLSSFPVGPFLSSFSVLHPSFLLSLNSRRATARTFPVTFSLVNFSGFFSPTLPAVVRVASSCSSSYASSITEIRNCIGGHL